MSSLKERLDQTMSTRDAWYQTKKKNGARLNSWRVMRPNGVEVKIWATPNHFIIQTLNDENELVTRSFYDLKDAIGYAEELAKQHNIPAQGSNAGA